MITFANAKINIGLHITQKRADGYHNIETVFYPIQMYDVIEVLPFDSFQFHTDGLSLSSAEKNICEKAYDLLKQDFSIGSVSIHLLKNIPIGAGLGGGSSDAAHVLKLLNDINNLGLSQDTLRKYSAKLGADCPFFIDNQAVFASGIGADFEDVTLDLSSYWIAVIKPDIHISTVEAYRHIIPRTPPVDLRRAIRLPIQEWKYHICNDFELGIFAKYPVIEEIKHNLYEKGALYASMSGSGSSVYGIFDKETDLENLQKFGKIYYPVVL